MPPGAGGGRRVVVATARLSRLPLANGRSAPRASLSRFGAARSARGRVPSCCPGSRAASRRPHIVNTRHYVKSAASLACARRFRGGGHNIMCVLIWCGLHQRRAAAQRGVCRPHWGRRRLALPPWARAVLSRALFAVGISAAPAAPTLPRRPCRAATLRSVGVALSAWRCRRGAGGEECAAAVVGRRCRPRRSASGAKFPPPSPRASRFYQFPSSSPIG